MSVIGCFTKVVHNSIAKKLFFSNIGTETARYSSLWVPDYLILGKQKTPEYDLVNVQIKGYDFVILENYQRLIHKLARIMAIKVESAWPTPHQDLKINKFKPNSTVSESSYMLKLYERNVQVVDVKSHIMPLFIEAVITACPPSVKISVHNHLPEMSENRYIPNFEILELNEKLSDLSDSLKKKKKKK